MIAVEALDRVAALARLALVAARSVVVVEIGAARTLEQVAADGRHVADLRRCAREDRPGQHRIARPHQPMLGDCGVARSGADPQPAAGLLDDVARQSRHVDQRHGPLDRLAHQVDQVGAAAEILGVRHARRGARHQRHRSARV